METLEMNPLYRAFLTKFRRQFEVACKMSFVIAIPHCDSMEGECAAEIDQDFANSHILMPSKLLRMHFTPLQIGPYDDIEMDQKKLICRSTGTNNNNRTIQRARGAASNVVIINILAEEIGYNVHQREYRTILIDKPLASPSTSRPLIRTILAPLSPRIDPMTLAKRRRISKFKQLSHHDECVKYLECLSPRLTNELEDEVRRMQSNYIILSHYLEDAAARTEQLAENYMAKFAQALEEDQGLGHCENVHRTTRMAVENCIVHLLHGKLMVATHSLYEREDCTLSDKLQMISRAKLTICQLGAQLAFSDFNLDDRLLVELRRLPDQQSPIAVVTSLIRIIDLINENLNRSVTFKRLMGAAGSQSHRHDNHQEMQAVPILSDDLIACLVHCLAQAKPNNLYSLTKYLEMFGWTTTARDQAAYYTATFRIVVEYIFAFTNAAAAEAATVAAVIA